VAKFNSTQGDLKDFILSTDNESPSAGNQSVIVVAEAPVMSSTNLQPEIESQSDKMQCCFSVL
jgi:hypothetical protein